MGRFPRTRRKCGSQVLVRFHQSVGKENAVTVMVASP